MGAGPQPRIPLRAALQRVARSWLELTAEEQRALAVVLGLFLLGVAYRFWHTACR